MISWYPKWHEIQKLFSVSEAFKNYHFCTGLFALGFLHWGSSYPSRASRFALGLYQ